MIARRSPSKHDASEAAEAPGLVTFLSDYGLDDAFVGVCKGVMAQIAPAVRVIDICHLVAPQAVDQGATILASAVAYLPTAVHLALVDPFGKTASRGVAVQTAAGSVVVAPDNGVASQAWTALGGAVAAYELAEPALWLPNPSRTFRGRDVFAPVAAHLASGTPVSSVGPEVAIESLVSLRLREPTVDDDHVHGEVRTVDHFGNLALNIRRSDLEVAGIALGDRIELRCGGKTMQVPFTLTYGDVPPGRVTVCEDSFRLITVAVNLGNAARTLRAGRGDAVVLARVPVPAPVSAGRIGI
ncbi:MAG: SAM-dependent chlorinase/fluorinase [Actinomycetota bacterium]|nr:SAM-dependent chlorinase/fluorinase [Actinomycetota bacterium]